MREVSEKTQQYRVRRVEQTRERRMLAKGKAAPDNSVHLYGFFWGSWWGKAPVCRWFPKHSSPERSSLSSLPAERMSV